MTFKYLLLVDVGPFTPLVGFVGAIAGAIFLIRQLIWGRKQIWMTPGDILPKVSTRIVSILCGVSMVKIYLYATPETLSSITAIAIGFVLGLLASYVLYYFLESNLTYNNAKTSTKIIGGFKLTSRAKELKGEGKTIQMIFDGANFPEEVWERTSMSAAKTSLLCLYLMTMACGTIGMTAGGLAIQVKLTKKAATEVIKKNEAPGLESKNKP